ncbi:hypothetical protein ACJX0J_036872, partial [Zea mays]
VKLNAYSVDGKALVGLGYLGYKEVQCNRAVIINSSNCRYRIGLLLGLAGRDE